MAETRLQFIDSNPATEAFQHGVQVATQEMRQQQAIDKTAREESEAYQTQGSRLRRVGAESDLAVTRAGVAQQTAPYDVSKAQSGASLEGTRASVAAQTAPYDVSKARSGASLEETRAGVAQAEAPYAGPKAAAGLEQAQGQARTTTSGANVAEKTEGTKVDQAGANLRSTELQNQKTNAQIHLDEINLITQGRTDVAQYMAKQRGEEIPPNIVENEEARGKYAAWLTDAIRNYPNMPKSQDAYVQGLITAHDAAHPSNQQQPAPEQAGQQPAGEYPQIPPPQPAPQQRPGPLDVHKPPPNAPPLPEQSFGRGGQHLFAPQIRQAMWLAVHPGDQQGALDFASGRKALSGQELGLAAQRLAQQQLEREKSRFTRDEVNNRAAEIVDWVHQQQTQTAPAAPAAPATGRGTPAQPAQAAPPMQGAKQAPDGNWYVPDPNRPGKYLRVDQ